MPFPTDPTPSGGGGTEDEKRTASSLAAADVEAEGRSASFRKTILLEVAASRELIAVIKDLARRLEYHLDYIEETWDESG